MGRFTHMIERPSLGRIAGEFPCDVAGPELHSRTLVAPDTLAFADSDGSGDLLLCG